MNAVIYSLNYGLLFSCLFETACPQIEKRFSLGLIRLLIFLPLLALEYLYFSAYLRNDLVAPLFFSENVFALTCILLACNLPPVILPLSGKSIPLRLTFFVAIFGLAFAGAHKMFRAPQFSIYQGNLFFPVHGHLYFASLFLLIAVLVIAWRLEAFWRALRPRHRWSYKYMVIGIFLISGTIGWSTALRLAYLHLNINHLLLSAVLLVFAWLLTAYAVIGNRLVNRSIFVSRKVVYATIAPAAFAGYFFAIGIISLLMKSFGWSLHFVLQWALVIGGLLVISIIAFSTKVRANVKYFISTHFYVNKYEYRDEWLAFSDLLHQKLTENGICDALQHILQDSLYTDTIIIWVGDTTSGFRLTGKQDGISDAAVLKISVHDPLIQYLKNAPYLDLKASDSKAQCLSKKGDHFSSMGLALLVPLTIGEHFLGIIGLGSEYTGGRYGKDDFDLLAALCSQASSALLAVRMAEELARAREQFAWDTLSAFVLHDIKNAVTMLSLVKENAPRHIQNPEFQHDMLDVVDDALKRMLKVQSRLNNLNKEITPVLTSIKAGEWVNDCCEIIGKKLSSVRFDIECRDDFFMHTDQDFLGIILENMVLNAIEACAGNRVRVWIKIESSTDGFFLMECTDNGPGIPLEMLPDRLFAPFITSKPEGSGIGMWQAKKLVESLGGEIRAQNSKSRGARFTIRLPVNHEAVYGPAIN